MSEIAKVLPSGENATLEIAVEQGLPSWSRRCRRPKPGRSCPSCPSPGSCRRASRPGSGPRRYGRSGRERGWPGRIPEPDREVLADGGERLAIGREFQFAQYRGGPFRLRTRVLVDVPDLDHVGEPETARVFPSKRERQVSPPGRASLIKVARTRPVATSQSLTARSLLPLNRVLPSGENADGGDPIVMSVERGPDPGRVGIPELDRSIAAR